MSDEITRRVLKPVIDSIVREIVNADDFWSRVSEAIEEIAKEYRLGETHWANLEFIDGKPVVYVDLFVDDGCDNLACLPVRLPRPVLPHAKNPNAEDAELGRAMAADMRAFASQLVAIADEADIKIARILAGQKGNEE
jgi:hypothetical protein